MKKRIVSMSPLNTDILMMMIKGAGASIPENIEIISANQLSDNEILELVKEADIILGDYSFNRKITGEIARAGKRLKLIQQPSVGYQNIDVDACTKAGIPVANTAGANTVSVAEYTVMAGLGLLKKLLTAHRTTFAGEWRQLDMGAGELQGKLWGLVGMGKIGRAVADRLAPFGVRVIYYDVAKMSENDESKYNAAFGTIDEILRNADIVSFHCPLTEETRGIVSEKNLALMKPTAYIINAARGEVIDEPALAKALREKRIAGAALDVFSNEPIRSDNPFLGLEDSNLILTPHIAGVTNEAKIRIISTAVRNMVAVLDGGDPEFLVNSVKRPE